MHDDDPDPDDDEMPVAVGADYTHWACPECGDENEVEGDMRGEIVACSGCDTKVKIV